MFENKKNIDKYKDQIFQIVQKLLKDPPVIIWGSGATIPYGLPSMNDLKQTLLKSEGFEFLNIESLKSENSNLEVELEKVQDQDQDEINKIKTCIRSEVFKKDIECLKKSIEKSDYFCGINNMIEKFYEVHPHKIDIITTNYDRVLEYTLSKFGYDYTDGFTGRQLAQFSKDNFQTKNQINLMKVHGSLNWVQFKNNDPFFLSDNYKIDDLQPLMILPSRKKYQDAFEEPYRTIIAKSDEIIEKAKSFLIIGFGFNDEHITPKLENKVKKGTPIVIITKKATDSCKEQIQRAKKYCLFEEGENKTTKITSSEQLGQDKTEKLEGNYWRLETFMEVL